MFELSKKQEMKDLLQTYADGQVEMLQRVSGVPLEAVSHLLTVFGYRGWTIGTESSRCCRGYAWTFEA